jgi:serum/glucocorticoid-regulated kinase 2
LTRDVEKRLGSRSSEDVKKHPFFKDLDWDKLEKKELDAPWKPKVKGENDISQIDTAFTQERAQDSLVDNHLSDTMQKENAFDAFTYVAPNAMEGKAN